MAEWLYNNSFNIEKNKLLELHYKVQISGYGLSNEGAHWERLNIFGSHWWWPRLQILKLKVIQAWIKWVCEAFITDEKARIEPVYEWIIKQNRWRRYSWIKLNKII